jgi:hypothetical protein
MKTATLFDLRLYFTTARLLFYNKLRKKRDRFVVKIKIVMHVTKVYPVMIISP